MHVRGACAASMTALLMSLAALGGSVVEIRNSSFEQVGTNGYPVGWSACPNWRGERIGHNKAALVHLVLRGADDA